MSDGGWRGRREPEGPGYGDSQPSSSRTVPIYVLFLIMLGSGILTLILLWVCVQFLYHRRRVRRARADVERNAAAQQEWELAEGARHGAKEVEADAAKRCDAGVELTYVVMAGEEQPTFLARRLSTSPDDPPSPSSPTTSVHDDAARASDVAMKAEKTPALEN